MGGFDPKVWYILHDAANTTYNTLTAGSNSEAAFDPNSPSAIYYAPQNATNVGAQLWQLFQVNTTSSSIAYILRNRQIGSTAYLTTAETTRKCGGGNCATVPVLSPNLNAESLWEFGAWGFSDLTGGAYVYNLGNGSNWRLDYMDGVVSPDGIVPELVNFDDTGRLAQHWFVNSYTTLAAAETSMFATVPSTATALLAQYTDGSSNGSTASVTPYFQASSTSASASSTASNSSGANSSGSSSTSHTSSLSTGAAIGIGVGVACLVFLVAAILAFICFRRRRPRKAAPSYDPVEIAPSPRAPIRDENVKYAELGSPPSPRSPAMSQSKASESFNSMSAELMSPSERSRVELEHPSTRLSAS